MLFKNESIDINSLPSIDLEKFTPIEKRYRIIMVINSIISATIITIPIILVSIFNAEVPLYVGYALSAVLLAYIIFNIFWSRISIQYKSYLLRSNDILFKKGVIWKKTTAIPFNRIQHVEVKQSAIAKQLNLSKIVIFTAGGNTGDLAISGLNDQTANKIREFIMGKLKDYV